MIRQFCLIALTVSSMMCLPLADCWGRGFGGGRGGGGRSFGGGGHSFGGGGHSFGGGGGFSGGGGHSFSGGGFSGGGHSFGGGGGRSGSGGFGAGGSFGGGGSRGGSGGFGAGGSHGGSFGGGGSRGGSGGFGAGGSFGGGHGTSEFGGNRFGGGGPGAAGAGGGRMGGAGFGGQRGGAGAGGFGRGGSGSPNRSQLNSFLGLPSDGGLHHLGGATGGAGGAGRPGVGAGGVGRPGVGVGGAGRPGVGVGGAGRPGVGVGGVGRPGVGVGGVGRPGVGVGGVGRPGVGIGGVGRPGVGVGGAGFNRVSPSARYTNAAVVRTNFNHPGVYGAGWYTAHPGAWRAAGWGAGAAWRVASWASVGDWMSYYPATPVYYDYGNNVTYQDDSVYVNGQDEGTSAQYYQQAQNLAYTGAEEQTPDEKWMPLGVFALTKSGHTSSDVTIQLAVNKQGIIRGNYTDTKTDKTQLVQGSVDKQTQRAAFTVGDNKSNIIETGIYNLTKDEAPVLIHFGKDRTEQWLLVRLKKQEG